MVNVGTRFFIPLSVILLTVVLLIPVASAVGVHPSQEVLTLTMERGSTQSIFLLLNEVYEEANLDAEGEISNWIRFGEGEEEEITISESSLGNNLVLMTISVPDGVDLDEYKAITRIDGRKLSSLRLKVTLELSDAKAFSKLSDVDEEVGTLQERVETLTSTLTTVKVQLADVEREVTDKMQEIYEYQRDVTTLEDEKNRLEDENAELDQDLDTFRSKSQDLEESNTQLNEMTGMLVGTSLPGMFFGGMILGIIAVTLVVKRSHVARNVKGRVNKLRKRGQEDRKYSWKS